MNETDYNHLCNIINQLPYDSHVSEGYYLQSLEVNKGNTTHSFKLEDTGFHVYMGHSHYTIPYSKEDTIVSVIKTLVEEGWGYSELI